MFQLHYYGNPDLEAPVVVVVKAKQDDFRKGAPQCVAAMIAARIFNEWQGPALP
jgi:hypothetical protein